MRRNQEVASVQYKLRDKEGEVGRVSWQASQAQHGLAHAQATLNKARFLLALDLLGSDRNRI